jgi:Big-like domain-containing protein
VIAVIVALNACAPTAPSQSSSLVIIPAVTALRMGETQQYSAIFRTASTQSPASPTEWTSDRPEVCDVTAAGVVTGVSIGTARITVTVAKEAASVDIKVVRDIGGTWTGQAFRSVRRVSGAGPYDVPPDETLGYEIRIKQTHDQLKATEPITGFQSELVGSITATNQISLSGMFSSSEGTVFDINPWSGEIDATSHLRGSFVATLRFINGFGPQVIEIRESGLDLVRD